MAEQYLQAVMVLIEIGTEMVQKISRIYNEGDPDADAYVESIKEAMKAGTRPDVYAVWKQTGIRKR
jgi:hypothetical protein